MKQRNLLNLVALLLLLPGFAALAWVFLGSFQPTTATLQKHVFEVDLSRLAPGSVKQIDWEGSKVFILHRTKDQIAWLKTYTPSSLVESAKDRVFSPALLNSFRSFHEKFLVISFWNNGKKSWIREIANSGYLCEGLVYESEKIQLTKTIVFPGGFYCKNMINNPSSENFYESPYVYDPAGRSYSVWVTPLEIPYHAFEGDKLILGKR
ncbi:hypothetical protein MCAMS1_01509 [biofilm metagenome]